MALAGDLRRRGAGSARPSRSKQAAAHPAAPLDAGALTNVASPNQQQLIESQQGLVRSLAAGVRRRLPPSVDMDELIAYGQVGLAEAARDFDPGRGIQFSTFAYYRVRGAIYDALSKISWFAHSGGCDKEADAEDSRAVVDASTPSPPAAAMRRELEQFLSEMVDRLPCEAATLIRAVYFEGQTLEEAGKRLGISKSWASRLNAKTLRQLASFLQQKGWDSDGLLDRRD